MNNRRRSNIQKAIELIERAGNMIDEARYEEQESMDNIPEALQGSERYIKMEDACDSLERAYDRCSDIIETLNDAVK